VRTPLFSSIVRPRRRVYKCLKRRARAELLWSFAALLALQLGLSVAVDQWLLGVRDPEYAVRETRLVDHVRKTPDAPLLLVLGSSRTQLALQAGRLSATTESGTDAGERVEGGKAVVFNFGMPACGPMMQLVCLRRLLDKGIRPDRLFLEIMPPMLSCRRGEPMEERMLDGSRLSVREVAKLWSYYRQPRRLLWKWGLAQCLAVHYRSAALDRALTIGLGIQGADRQAYDYLMDDYGWQPLLQTVDDEQRSGLTRLAHDQYGDPLAHFEVSPHASRALFELLAICRSKGIEVTLVLMPEGTAFRALYPPEADDRLERYLAELCGEGRAKLVDARRWVDDADFTDSHHVLPRGAEIFSNRFQAEVLRPVLAERQRTLSERHRFR
jgi:hypothetical protein